MLKLLLFLAFASALTGCASTALPICDGTDRRPINTPVSTDVVYPSCGVTAKGHSDEKSA